MGPRANNDTRAVFDAVRRLVQALRLSSKDSEKRLGVSAAQLFVLQKISEARKPPSINALAEATLTHQSSVSVVVTKLARQGLVERVRSKADSRAVELKLTAKGFRLLARSPGSIQDRLRDAIEAMPALRRRALVDGLTNLVRNAGLDGGDAPLFFEEGKKKTHARQTR